MPTVWRLLGFRFHFYSNEGMEPPHIHVAHGSAECKFWLDPITLAANRGMPPNDVRRTERIVFEHQHFLLEKHRAFHHD